MSKLTENYGPAPDYSKKECWYRFPEITKDVDTFYIYATEYKLDSMKEGAPDFATLDNAEMLEGVVEEYTIHASAFEASTNLFMPLYRQSGLRYVGEVYEKTGTADGAFAGMPIEDIIKALDYYFENCNGGRPFIISGHSQGSAMVLMLLRTYFKDHPEYYSRMVAAYAIGYSVTDEYLAANPHLKFATGECDTGVIIAYNTEGPENVETNARNVVVTHAKGEPLPEEIAKASAVFFGPDGRHANDYVYYYNNIKDNAAKRVAAYLAKR